MIMHIKVEVREINRVIYVIPTESNGVVHMIARGQHLPVDQYLPVAIPGPLSWSKQFYTEYKKAFESEKTQAMLNRLLQSN
jgi:hypothetical protein